MKAEILYSLLDADISIQGREMVIECHTVGDAYCLWQEHKDLCKDIAIFRDVRQIKLTVSGRSFIPPFGCAI